jgi:hypothetical protein
MPRAVKANGESSGVRLLETRWIRARHEGICRSCARDFLPHERVLYWGAGFGCECESCGAVTWALILKARGAVSIVPGVAGIEPQARA